MPCFIYTQDKFDFYFFSTIGYLNRNTGYINNSPGEWDDFLSSIGGEITYRGGEFAESQYEINLRYRTNYSQPENYSVLLRQLYVQIPLTEYSFVTVGKIEKNFGNSLFHDYANKISPKERLLGQIDKIERQGKGIVQYDWIASPELSLGAFIWGSRSKKWKDLNSGLQAEYQKDNFYSGIYLYYEKSKYLSLGYNISQQVNDFRVYLDGIIKKQNEQYYADILKFKKELQSDLTLGFSYESGFNNIILEYSCRSEGFSDNEKNLIKDYIAVSKDISGYNKSYYAKNYIGISYDNSHTVSQDISLGFQNLISLDDFGSELNIYGTYLHKQQTTFGLNYTLYYGSPGNEYFLFLPYKYQIIAYISINF